jgi:hypothetical protein
MLTGEQNTEGGIAMTKQGLSSPGYILPIQIWAGLPAEDRARAVRLMVKLAFKLVTSKLDWMPKEVNDVKPNGHTQSTS